MQDIEPYYNWLDFYDASNDEKSPFFGREYNLNHFENNIYGYYIHPQWDEISSETLYIKILYVCYEQNYTIIEMFGEWNDTLHNDIMHFKRNVIDVLLQNNINKYILIGENIFNFHGGDDDYYSEWFDEIEDGWIAACNFKEFVEREFDKYNLDNYINFGGTLLIQNWRTASPQKLFKLVNTLIMRRIG